MFNQSTERVLEYLQTYFAEHGYSPLLREIIEATAYSTATVYTALNALEAHGHIERKESGTQLVASVVGYERPPLRSLPELPPLVGLRGQPVR